MPEDRLNDYLDSLTSFSHGLPYTHIAALDSYAPSYDEWAVMRLMAGQRPGTFAYDYRVKQADDTACVIQWYEGGKLVGESSFTRQEAAAGNVDKSWDKEKSAWKEKATWKAFPSDMLFARAISRGARRYAPGIFGGAPIYTPDEMGVDTDEDGHIVQGEVINVTPPAANARRNRGKTAAKPATDLAARCLTTILTIEEAPAAQFIPNVAADLLKTDADDYQAAHGGTEIVSPAHRAAAHRSLSRPESRHGRGR
jgi:hypothetical protein